MQDMRGSKEVGGKFDKNNEIFSTTWDLVIVDEAHEGTQTELGKAVLEQLISKNTKILRLSGTPFNLLDDHKEEEVFTWDYVMEQKAKIDWEINHLGDTNPYASLPAIHIYTYDLGRLMSEYSDEEKAFNFREFFRTREDGSFVHERDIDHFLTLLTTDDEESLYPYSNDSFRQIFRHTLWILPGVKAAKALSRKLAKHPVFGLFNVVNVAGDGDEEEESRDALELVNKAIGSDPDQSYTITLSCGRLTTGVSVKPWTGVFMMAGAYSTSAAGYMQTIFRVQTPYTHNGRMKTDCYAFDFAPDRTLRVLAETAKVSHKAGKQTEDDRKLLGDFLNFCPIIAIDGGQMKQYKVETMLAQLKRAQIEKVVQDGFENGALYNDELLKLTDVELKEFDDLKGIIGKTKAMPKSGDIDINRQGLTNEQYEEKEQLEKKKKKDLTPEEKKRLDELKAKGDQRREAISILRGISIRMPLMLYGAEMVDEDKELTIDNFAKLMDDQSWEEFMPRGVTKQVFARFKRYYDPDIFREAGKRIREMARMADKFTIEERIARLASIFATFRNPDKETVLTPWRVVNMHLGDSLGGYCFMNEDFTSNLGIPRYIEHKGVTTEVFHPQSVILEINSKSGLYPLYAAYNIYRTRLEQAREKYGEVNRATALMLWDLTLEENIFVVCKTPMARYITMRTLRGFRNTNVHTKYYPNLIESIITEPDSVVNMLRSGKRFWKINNDENMKIDAIIGNPPYQVTSENTSDAPVYHLFIDLASLLAQRVSLLTPARYLFNAGKTPKDWNTKILNDEHFKVVDYWANSTDVFPTVDIKGGVAVMYRDSKLDFGKIGTFTAYKKLNIIANKVCKISENGLFAKLIYAPESYRLSDKLHEDYPWAKERLSMGHPYDITTNIFEKLPEIFKETYQIKEEEVRFYGRYKNERCYRWIKREYVDSHPNLDKYKVIVPKSNGSGAIGEVLSSPLIGEPLIGVTQTFLTIGAFDTRTEAEACLKYVKTKFARTMLGILKATQDNKKETWRFVPLQDFTAASDIDWTLSVAEIDQQLYRKYGLEAEEIAFIEEKVRAMG
jgi:eco57I restriction endonuclease